MRAAEAHPRPAGGAPSPPPASAAPAAMPAPATPGAPADPARADPVPPAAPARARADRLWRLLVVAAPLAAALVAAGLVAAGLPHYGRWVAAEDTPMTWLQSVLLAAAALLAALVAARRWVGGGRLWPWGPLAAGLAWLSVDERFALHERARDGFLAERVPHPLPWGAPGDIVLLAYAVVALVVCRAVLRGLRRDRAATTALLAGLVLLAVAVAVDTVDPASLSYSAELALQSAEEVVELFGGTAIVLALALVALRDEDEDGDGGDDGR